jgi:hypothetical protein
MSFSCGRQTESPRAPLLSAAAAERLVRVGLPTLLIAIFLGLWQLSDTLFDIPVYMLPRPSDFLPQFWLSFPKLWHNTWPTALVILGGLPSGPWSRSAGLCHRISRMLEKGLYPALVIPDRAQDHHRPAAHRLVRHGLDASAGAHHRHDLLSILVTV